MSVSLLSKYSHFLCASVLAATLISSAQGNSPPSIVITILQEGDIAEVSEAADIGTVIAHVMVTDEDPGAEGQVSCSLDNEELFGLEQFDINEIKLILRGNLDRQEENRYNLQMTCSDNGSPPLSADAYLYVDVKDEHDNTPVFTFPTTNNNTVTIDTSNPLALATVTVTATDLDLDANGQVIYSIPDNQYPDLFLIDTNDGKGVLTVRRYPTDMQYQYTLTIKATDMGYRPKTISAELNIIFTGSGIPATTTDTIGQDV